jgi:uncharacterized protein YfaS (alpha-2-macroglobulin family)
VKAKAILPFMLTIFALLNVSTTIASSLTITVQTDKQDYNLYEDVVIYGLILYDGTPLPNITVAVEVRDPTASPIVTRSIQTNSSGAYTISFELQEGALPGNYSVHVSCALNQENAFNTTTFKLKQTSILAVTVTTEKQRYNIGENITIKGSVTLNKVGLPQALVAIEVQNPNATPIVVRVLKTNNNGNYSLTFLVPTGSPRGNYTIHASTSYEEKTAKATAIFTIGSQAGSADLNGDGKVNIMDLTIVALAFGSYPGHPRWNPICDLNGDNLINIVDLMLVAREYKVT